MPHTKDFLGRKGCKEPERLEETHRPTGVPQGREAQSQKVQYEAMPNPDNQPSTRSYVRTRRKGH